MKYKKFTRYNENQIENDEDDFEVAGPSKRKSSEKIATDKHSSKKLNRKDSDIIGPDLEQVLVEKRSSKKLHARNNEMDIEDEPKKHKTKSKTKLDSVNAVVEKRSSKRLHQSDSEMEQELEPKKKKSKTKTKPDYDDMDMEMEPELEYKPKKSKSKTKLNFDKKLNKKDSHTSNSEQEPKKMKRFKNKKKEDSEKPLKRQKKKIELYEEDDFDEVGSSEYIHAEGVNMALTNQDQGGFFQIISWIFLQFLNLFRPSTWIT